MGMIRIDKVIGSAQTGNNYALAFTHRNNFNFE